MKKEFVKILCSSSKGLILGCNIMDAIVSGLVDRNLAIKILKSCLLSFDPNKHKSSEDVILLFENIASGKLGGKCYYFACSQKAKTISGKGIKFANATKFNTFLRRMVHPADRLSSIGSRIIQNSNPSSPAFIRNLEKNAFGKCKLRKDGFIGREGGLIWITEYPNIKNLQKLPYDIRTDRARNKLGLVHYDKRHTIIVFLFFTGDDISKQRNSRPTFVDAGSHSRFKTLPDDIKNKKRSGWGYTVDLEKFVSDQKIIDGLPERVVESISTNVKKEIDFWISGALFNNSFNDGPHNDDEFRKRLMINRSKNDITSFLLGLI